MSAPAAFLPKHIFRLCALGTVLQNGQMPYGDLAESVHDFITHLVGPSLDLMGSSLEVLRYEGLVAVVGATPAQGSSDAQSILTITPQGREEFRSLMTAGVELALDEHARLVISLKVRFLHLLPVDQQTRLAEDLAVRFEQTLHRLQALNSLYEREPGHLSAWLTHDITLTQRRLEWFRSLTQAVTDRQGRLPSPTGEPGASSPGDAQSDTETR